MKDRIYKIVRPSRSSYTIFGINCLQYTKGSIVIADAKTLGIFCFKSYKYAKEWLNSYIQVHDYLILKVKPIGEASYPKKVQSVLWNGSLNLDKKIDYSIDGSVCYPSVKVIT